MTEQEKQFITLRKRLLSTATPSDTYVVLGVLMARLSQYALSPVLTQEERKSASAHLSFIEKCFEELSNMSLKSA